MREQVTRTECLSEQVSTKQAIIQELTERLSQRQAMLVSLPGMTDKGVDQSRLNTINQQASKIQQLEVNLLESAERTRIMEDEVTVLT